MDEHTILKEIYYHKIPEPVWAPERVQSTMQNIDNKPGFILSVFVTRMLYNKSILSGKWNS